MWKYLARNSKLNVNIFVSFSTNLAPSRNILNNKSVIVVYTENLITGIDFDTKIYLSVKPRLSMKNFDFSNRQRLKQSAREII